MHNKLLMVFVVAVSLAVLFSGCFEPRQPPAPSTPGTELNLTPKNVTPAPSGPFAPCSDAANDLAKDDCYQDMAFSTSNVSYCGRIYVAETVLVTFLNLLTNLLLTIDLR